MKLLRKAACLLVISNLSKSVSTKYLWTRYAQRKRSGLKYVSRHNYFTQRIADLSQDIRDALEKKISQSEFYSIGFNERNDLSNTIQLSIFVIGVTNNFETVE